ncbi:SCO6880 family protein [Micromonospora sp. NPDC050397]|uniref:SCO6880 family protein n=1 Tax=Micromonospora sp. NPDC050397 TaxID=3364279 RepID=UPI00384DCE48
MTEIRTSRLGGELRRRTLFGGSRSRAGNLILGCGLAMALLFAVIVGGLVGIGSALLLFTALITLTRQNPVTGRSPGRDLALAVRWQIRQGRGETTLLPLHLAQPVAAPGNRRQRREVRAWARSIRTEAPGLEGVAWLSVAGQDGTVLLHHPPGEPAYLSVAIEVDGQAPGLRTDRDYDQAAAAYGRLLGRLARENGLISGIQSVTRIMPLDSAAHEQWAASHVDPDAPEPLLSSYAELVQMTAGAAEMVRHYLAIRLPLTAGYAKEAAASGPGEEGMARLAIVQARWVASLAAYAGLLNPRILSAHHLAALFRHLQNPDFPLDQTVDVSPTTWLRAQRAERHAAVVDDRWWHRVAAIPRSAVTAEPVGTRWIAPLLYGMTAPVHRTISLSVAVEPAALARRQARQDLTLDLGQNEESARRGAVDDGSQAVQMSASAQRLADLQPGSGIHGARWAGWVAVSAPSQAEVMRAATRIGDAADECGIAQLDWLTCRHDEGMPATWPVWRGMETST